MALLAWLESGGVDRVGGRRSALVPGRRTAARRRRAHLWLLLLFFVPFLIVLNISFSEVVWRYRRTSPSSAGTTVHPRCDLHWSATASCSPTRSTSSSYLNSIKVASISTLLCLLIGYPMAYAIARSTPTTRTVLLMLVVLPFWTSLPAARVRLDRPAEGQRRHQQRVAVAGPDHEPLHSCRPTSPMYIGIVYSYLPFLILPLYANLEKHELALLEAAEDLGAAPWQAFYKITLPLSRTVFSPARCWCSSRRSASTSFRRCSAARTADDRPGAVG